MLKKLWSYATIVFMVVTKGSFRLALRISKIHDSALFAQLSDPFISGLYTVYHALHLAYVDLYAEWVSKKLNQLSATQILNDLLILLRKEKINEWDAAIAIVYKKGSAKYNALLGKGHKLFQQGTQEERIATVLALIKAIGTDAALATLKVEIQLFYDKLSDADTAQKAAIKATTTASDKLEEGRVAMCKGQYVDLGQLMSHFVDNTLLIEVFFDLKSIRKSSQVLFMRLVKKLSTVMIVERTMEADQQLLLENNGVTILHFYLGLTKDAAMGATFVTVLPGKQITVSASELGDVTTQHFLLVSNPDDINKGDCTVEIE